MSLKAGQGVTDKGGKIKGKGQKPTTYNGGSNDKQLNHKTHHIAHVMPQLQTQLLYRLIFGEEGNYRGI